MSGVRGAVLNGVCANSCRAQDSACAAVWASANANASLANCQVPALLTLERFISSTCALERNTRRPRSLTPGTGRSGCLGKARAARACRAYR